MDSFIRYLLQFGSLNPEQIALIESKITERLIPRHEYYFEAGKVQREIAFIAEGVIRIIYYNKSNEEITKYFMSERQFPVDLNSYTQGIPTAEYAQAVTDCRLIVISKTDMQDLSMTIIQWDEIIQRITSKSLLEKVNRISAMVAEDATERYLHFIETYPTLVNRIPLAYLASYLGITQSSLSRIRRSISGRS